MAKQGTTMKCILTILLFTTSITYGQIPNNKTLEGSSAYKHKYVYPHDLNMRDTIFTNPTDTIIDTGQTTIGIITSKKNYDTVRCKALIKNETTKKIIAAQIYLVRKILRYTEPGEKPKYYFEDIGYLGQDKKPLPTNLKVIQSEELK